MDDQFDKKLSNRIREVFDNYEHPGADAAWEKLRKQLPAQKSNNKVAWLWWSSAAAIAVIFLGLGIWYINQDTDKNNFAVKPVVKQQQQPAAPLTKPNADTSIRVNPSAIAGNQLALAANTPAFNNNISTPHYSTPSAETTTAGNVATNPEAKQTNTINNQLQPVFNDARPTSIAQTSPGTNSSSLKNAIATPNQIAGVKPVDASITDVTAPNTATNGMARQKPAKTINDMFADDNLHKVAKNNTAEKQADKKVNFSVYAATYFNYAEGSTNQINAGAGFTSDFKLSKNLKLSTGVALAQNSLSYNSGAPSATAAKEMVAAAPALKREALFATTAVLPIFKNYNASLVGLDIPINLKYEFNPQKSDTYVSAGLSSGTFINESYTYNYTYGNGASSNSNGEDKQTTSNSFNSFYFGKTLNLSFGVGYPVGGNRLIVEPFVKYPLSGLGAQDIRFGAGGINLKFSFKTQKK